MLVVFGPGKTLTMGRDLGRFASDNRDQLEAFKGKLLDGGEEDPKDTISDPL
jgi:Sec-independent protein translocase protein TatA